MRRNRKVWSEKEMPRKHLKNMKYNDKSRNASTAGGAAILAITIVAVAGCTPYSLHLTESQRREECGGIAAEYARQYDIAQRSGIMASFLVEGAVRLNTINVISGLQTQAAIARCPWAIPLSRAPSGDQQHLQTAPASYATLSAPHRNGYGSLRVCEW